MRAAGRSLLSVLCRIHAGGCSHEGVACCFGASAWRVWPGEPGILLNGQAGALTRESLFRIVKLGEDEPWCIIDVVVRPD